MKGFLLGLLVAGLGLGGYLYWKRLGPAPSGLALVMADAGAPSANKRRRRHSRGVHRATRGLAANDSLAAGEPEPEPVHLSAADLRPVAQGDDLARPDVLRLDMSTDKELPELSQDQIDERFRGRESAILDCITRARPDPETYVPGRVTIKFRIQRAGTVRGVRVEGPAILQRNGLYSCIKNVLAGMRFPAAGTSQIASYPFTLS